ncbi:MAG: alpha/beta fold hydrolase [Xanthomonadaceae bacterium]|nr:alpha/beta fold hydrolase [Xanthomonadaceae bacterium]
MERRPPRPADFRPPRLLRNPHVQSVLASSALRRLLHRRRNREVEARSSEVLLDCGDGVRLQGFHAATPARPARGLVVLLHGWEGSAQSSYMLGVGRRLLDAGYDVFRLNFRDHGATHHLNREIFHSCRIDEVVGAVRDVSRRYGERPLHVAGFSLGGNFALRVGLRAPAAGIPLAGVVAVCPAIHPPHILRAMERGPRLYHDYFMLKWRASLKRKMRLFPEAYVFEPRFLKLPMREMTAELIARYTDFESLDAYFDGYSIRGDRLRSLAVPASILTSRDDPIIPVDDFHALELPPHVTLDIAPYGGHCGFIRDWSLRSYAEDFLIERLAAGGGR